MGEVESLFACYPSVSDSLAIILAARLPLDPPRSNTPFNIMTISGDTYQNKSTKENTYSSNQTGRPLDGSGSDASADYKGKPKPNPGSVPLNASQLRKET